jgi:hypothetical protein
MYYGIARVDDILLNLVAMSELGRLKKLLGRKYDRMSPAWTIPSCNMFMVVTPVIWAAGFRKG